MKHVKRLSVWGFLAMFLGFSAIVVAQKRSDHALLNEPGADVSVQCGAIGGQAAHPVRKAFTMHITLTNRVALGGAGGTFRVAYQDGDIVDFWIGPNGTVDMTLAAGGTLGVDDIITVSGDGPGGSVLTGQASMSTDLGKPHPGLLGQTGKDFCTTS